MLTFIRIGLAMIAAAMVGCAGELSYKRVDELPPGAQIDSFASAFHAVVRTPRVRYLFSASYQDVWAATKGIIEPLKATGTEPQLSTDEEHGLIVLTLDHRDDIAKTMDNPNPIRIKGWREELRFELVRRPDDRTLIVVSRLVLGVPFNRRCPEYVDPCPNPILFEPEVSNGQVERWVLTRIHEEVAKLIIARVRPPALPRSAPEESVAAPQPDQPAAVATPPAPPDSAPAEVVPTPPPAQPAATATSPAPPNSAPEESVAAPRSDVPGTGQP